ncbi:MAG: helix-turn-helix domain-containing protein [Pseudomonadota bacterium]
MKTHPSPCPIAGALDIFGDRWTLLVVRDLFGGRSHFKDFLASPEGISTAVLANRLQHLLDAGVIRQVPSAQVPGKQRYELTRSGRELYPVLKAAAEWAEAHVPGRRRLLDLETRIQT